MCKLEASNNTERSNKIETLPFGLKKVNLGGPGAQKLPPIGHNL